MKRLTSLLLCAALLGGAAPAAKAVKIVRNSAAMEFSYAWPAQAAAIPQLNRQFRADMDKAWRSAQATVREEQKLTRQQKRPFNPQFYSKTWSVAGDTPRLLSLEFDVGEFTGGAHPNSNSGALLWDRSLARAITPDSLFARPGGLQAVTRSVYCKALDAERLKRREGETLDGEFNECPKYSELSVAPVDSNKDGRFDGIDFVAAAYTAGPYVEGEYAIVVPVSAAIVAALKPQYRGSFAAQRQ